VRVGLWTAGGAAALAAGPLVGGLLIAAVGWRSIFFSNAPLGGGWWLTARYAAEAAPARDRGVDLPGQLTAVAGGREVFGTDTSRTAAAVGGGRRAASARRG
jgi:MFS transporter, DHA2 family, methylenomycin A resistance protein